MDVDPQDQEVIRLLTKIKDAEAGYPEHMLVERRRSYLRRMREVSLGIPTDTVVKDVKPTSGSPATTTLVETALVVAIIAEASTVAYFYRDRLTDFFRRAITEPRVQEVTPAPAVTTSFGIHLDATVPSATLWFPPSATGVVLTPTVTPIPDVLPGVVDNNSINTAATGEVNVLNGTPGPNDSNLNNGNHYGQTPKPERTKENGNNPPPKDNENKPPKEDNNQPPKDDNDQPPKDNSDKSP